MEPARADATATSESRGPTTDACAKANAGKHLAKGGRFGRWRASVPCVRRLLSAARPLRVVVLLEVVSVRAREEAGLDPPVLRVPPDTEPELDVIEKEFVFYFLVAG